jgi:4-amino-4-deoxy-L-arabinose transferase-like glycosyltransferase
VNSEDDRGERRSVRAKRAERPEQVQRAERPEQTPPARGPAPRGRAAHLWIAVLLAGTALLAFYRLGAGSLWDQDEPRYAEMAKEVVRTGDWVTMHFNGAATYIDGPPPFCIWLMAVSGGTAGFNEWTARFWSAAADVAGVFVTVLIGTRLFTPRIGLLAGAITATTFHLLVAAHLAVFDTVLLVWMLLAVHAFLRAYQTGGRADYLRFFLFCALATLTKGPLGLLLPGLVVAAFVTARGAWRRWREVPWAWGTALYLVVGWSWSAVETWLHGRAFAYSIFYFYGPARVTGAVDNHAGPWFFYAPVLILGAFPWTAFWPAAAVSLGRRLRTDDGSLFVVLWCALPAAFFSAAGTKEPNYILSVYPFAAIGVAALWDPVFDTGRITRPVGASLVLLAVMLGVFGGGFAAGRAQRSPGTDPALVGAAAAVVGVLILGGVIAALLIRTRPRSRAFAALCATAAAAWIATLTWVAPAVESQKPIKPLAQAIHARLRPGDRVIGYRFTSYGLIYYTDHTVEWVSRLPELREAVCAPGRAFVVTDGPHLSDPAANLHVGLAPFAGRAGVDVLVKPGSSRCTAPGGSVRP